MIGVHKSSIIAAIFASQVLLSCAKPCASQSRESQWTWRDDDGQPRSITTTEVWSQQRSRILERVQEVMGELPQPESPVPLSPQVVSETEEGLIVRKKISYHTDNRTTRVRAWLLIPSTPPKTGLPAVLCLHQTTAVGKDEPVGLAGDPNLAYARELAEQGFVALAPDYPSFGEHDHDFENDHYASGSMKAIYDNIRAVDYLETLAEVDADRIGVIGHSLGGHNSIYTAVFDPRLKVVVSSCGFTRFHKYYQGDLTGWTSQRYMPRIRDRYHANPDEMPFDFSDLIAALAPRPFLAIAPLHDHNFERSEERRVGKECRSRWSPYH